jgi:hypothetical protein
VLDGLSPLAHGTGIRVEPPLHGFEHMLVFPPSDPPLLRADAVPVTEPSKRISGMRRLPATRHEHRHVRSLDRTLLLRSLVRPISVLDPIDPAIKMEGRIGFGGG